MRKPKGYWLDRDNCMKEMLALAEKEQFEALPSMRKLEDMGVPKKAINILGGRKAVAKMLNVPLRKGTHEKQRTVLEKWEGKPSKAFEIEAEAREQGLCYADIQKAKTLAMVGGVRV